MDGWKLMDGCIKVGWKKIGWLEEWVGGSGMVEEWMIVIEKVTKGPKCCQLLIYETSKKVLVITFQRCRCRKFQKTSDCTCAREFKDNS